MRLLNSTHPQYYYNTKIILFICNIDKVFYGYLTFFQRLLCSYHNVTETKSLLGIQEQVWKIEVFANIKIIFIQYLAQNKSRGLTSSKALYGHLPLVCFQTCRKLDYWYKPNLTRLWLWAGKKRTNRGRRGNSPKDVWGSNIRTRRQLPRVRVSRRRRAARRQGSSATCCPSRGSRSVRSAGSRSSSSERGWPSSRLHRVILRTSLGAPRRGQGPPCQLTRAKAPRAYLTMPTEGWRANGEGREGGTGSRKTCTPLTRTSSLSSRGARSSTVQRNVPCSHFWFLQGTLRFLSVLASALLTTELTTSVSTLQLTADFGLKSSDSCAKCLFFGFGTVVKGRVMCLSVFPLSWESDVWGENRPWFWPKSWEGVGVYSPYPL